MSETSVAAVTREGGGPGTCWMGGRRDHPASPPQTGPCLPYHACHAPATPCPVRPPITPRPSCPPLPLPLPLPSAATQSHSPTLGSRCSNNLYLHLSQNSPCVQTAPLSTAPVTPVLPAGQSLPHPQPAAHSAHKVPTQPGRLVNKTQREDVFWVPPLTTGSWEPPGLSVPPGPCCPHSRQHFRSPTVWPPSQDVWAGGRGVPQTWMPLGTIARSPPGT